MSDQLVHVWQEKLVIPTYAVGEPDRNPMFFEKRVYQGSSGVVYPNPVIEKIYDEKSDKEYNGIFLENQYLKILVLPELGGRVQMAFDKIGQRHFVYYNQVIKPALVGLCGPWISGGIEFNWPQHHRPSTFDPVDHLVEHNEDGSKTVWVNEVERMFGTKGMAGFTLHPDKAYLEIKVKLYNRTPLPQTFLWWANPAVKVNDHYQSIFPPDVNAVFDHGKRDVSSFPIATGTYYKVDYSPGTDISRYKNIPVPTSYMAIHSDYDFVGGYEHDTEAGLLHVADHHVSPGKKQWTWGHGDFGRAWDRNLTDTDGPYIELMTGVFTDNQPDFSWLMPYEAKSFTQYFMPYRSLGLVKNATKDILLNVEKDAGHLQIKLFATSPQLTNTLCVMKGEEMLYNEAFDIAPERIHKVSIAVPGDVTADNIIVVIADSLGKETLRYEPGENKQNELPEPAAAAPPPVEMKSNEELYLMGQHLEQYRHATYSPVPYYEEALKRDGGDIRNNNALGAWYLRRGRFPEAEAHFRAGLKTLTQRNPNPYEGELYYNLGICLKLQDKLKEAYDSFYKACWNNSWQDSGYFSVAQVDMIRGHYTLALEHVQKALDKNADNSKAQALLCTVLRKQGRYHDAIDHASAGLKRDPFNLPLYYEQYLCLKNTGNDSAGKIVDELKELARGHAQNYIEYALDYAAAGQYEEAAGILDLYLQSAGLPVYPMVWYYMAWLHQKMNKPQQAGDYHQKGMDEDPGTCFPNRLEDIAVLKLAAMNEADAKAPYYLGNLWYDKRQYDEAITQWEISAKRDPLFPTVFRNLGIASFNKRNDAAKALAYYEKAFELNTNDPRVLMELDQLYKRMNKDPWQRLSFLEDHLSTVLLRDDLYLERAALYNFTGYAEKAWQLIMNRQFHPWEGGEGKVSGQYIQSIVEMAKQQLGLSHPLNAIELLTTAVVYPDNLGEGKLAGTAENDIYYWMGVACNEAGQGEEASHHFAKATEGSSEPAVAIFYNDRPPDKIFYQGLAWQKLGDGERASLIFSGLVEYGKAHMKDEIAIDYFAVSLPNLLIFEDDQSLRNKVHCLYIKGLGHLGLNERKDAIACFEKVLSLDRMHAGANTHLAMARERKAATQLNN
jgi:tetratricopeptide (TPR) repeat protein